MSDNQTADEEKTSRGIGDEFSTLGQNLSNLLRAAWDNPERKHIQEEIEGGLNDFANLLKSEADSFSESPTGQRLKSDISEINERLRNAETRNLIRGEVLHVMQKANSELRNIIDTFSVSAEDKNSEEDQ